MKIGRRPNVKPSELDKLVARGMNDLSPAEAAQLLKEAEREQTATDLNSLMVKLNGHMYEASSRVESSIQRIRNLQANKPNDTQGLRSASMTLAVNLSMYNTVCKLHRVAEIMRSNLGLASDVAEFSSVIKTVGAVISDYKIDKIDMKAISKQLSSVVGSLNTDLNVGQLLEDLSRASIEDEQLKNLDLGSLNMEQIMGIVNEEIDWKDGFELGVAQAQPETVAAPVTQTAQPVQTAAVEQPQTTVAVSDIDEFLRSRGL